jgi:putative proteasome-type protease
MTYCMATISRAGLVFCSDSRTNAGVDQVSTYGKMHKFGIPGKRQFVVLSAGNLATTQGVVSQMGKDIKAAAPVNLDTVASMSEAADYLGELSCAQQEKTGGGHTYEATFIIGGQILGESPHLFLVYAQGNHITTSKDTPYLQIGESKYGKPILDRILDHDTSLETAALCALVSMDSTMRSNLSVGPPIELQLYQADSFVLNRYERFDSDSAYLRELKKQWSAGLLDAFSKLPPLSSAPPRPAPKGR